MDSCWGTVVDHGSLHDMLLLCGALVEISLVGCVCFKRLCHLQGGQGPSGPPGDKGIAGEPVSISSSENQHNYWREKNL